MYQELKRTCKAIVLLTKLLFSDVAAAVAVVVFLRTFARNFSNIDFFLKLLPLKDDELAMSEM